MLSLGEEARFLPESDTDGVPDAVPDASDKADNDKFHKFRATHKRGKGQKWTASNVTLILSDQVNLDGTWVNMPDGYPMAISAKRQQIFAFRIPKFVDSAYYDPAVSTTGYSTGTSSATSNFGSALTALILANLMLVRA